MASFCNLGSPKPLLGVAFVVDFLQGAQVTVQQEDIPKPILVTDRDPQDIGFSLMRSNQ